MSSGDAARFRDDEYGKSELSGMGASSSTRNESAHKGEKDKEKKEKDKEDRDEGESSCIITNMCLNEFLLFQKLLKCLTATVLCVDEYSVQSLSLEHVLWSSF